MTTTVPTYDPSLFQGAAWYYARYRAKYPQALAALRESLLAVEPSGQFTEELLVTALVAWKS